MVILNFTLLVTTVDFGLVQIEKSCLHHPSHCLPRPSEVERWMVKIALKVVRSRPFLFYNRHSFRGLLEFSVTPILTSFFCSQIRRRNVPPTVLTWNLPWTRRSRGHPEGKQRWPHLSGSFRSLVRWGDQWKRKRRRERRTRLNELHELKLPRIIHHSSFYGGVYKSDSLFF